MTARFSRIAAPVRFGGKPRCLDNAYKKVLANYMAFSQDQRRFSPYLSYVLFSSDSPSFPCIRRRPKKQKVGLAQMVFLLRFKILGALELLRTDG